MYHFVADGEFSVIMTMSVMFQCLAVLLLLMQSLASGVACGISARALGLEALSLCLRLSSTTWLNGYLPSDASGDWVFQATDACTLLLVLGLLARVLITQRRSSRGVSSGLFPVSSRQEAHLLARSRTVPELRNKCSHLSQASSRQNACQMTLRRKAAVQKS